MAEVSARKQAWAVTCLLALCCAYIYIGHASNQTGYADYSGSFKQIRLPFSKHIRKYWVLVINTENGPEVSIRLPKKPASLIDDLRNLSTADRLEVRTVKLETGLKQAIRIRINGNRTLLDTTDYEWKRIGSKGAKSAERIYLYALAISLAISVYIELRVRRTSKKNDF